MDRPRLQRLRMLAEFSGHLPPDEQVVLRLVADESPYLLSRAVMDSAEIAAAQRLVKRGLVRIDYDEAAALGPSKGYHLTDSGRRALTVLAEDD